MRRMSRTPLAWSNLTHSKPKLLGSLAGITFAVALMFMEMGFQNALLDGMVRLVEKLDADLIIVSRSSYSFGFKAPFSRRRLQEVQRFADVEQVSPIYLDSNFSRWRHPLSGLRRSIRVVAFRPEDHVFLDPALASKAESLQATDTALFDVRGKWWLYGGAARSAWKIYEYLWSDDGPAAGTVSELAGRSIRLVGRFELGADLINDGTLLMSEENYRRYLGIGRPAAPDLLVDLGLIKLRPEVRADPLRVQRVLKEIDASLPDSVVVRAKPDLIAREKKFWLTNTPVGFVFQLGMIMGFIVGTVICYQILSSDISAYLREYATLLAMGYPRIFLVKVVIEEAIYLGLLGFTSGLIVAGGIYSAVEWCTRMPFVLDPWRIAMVFGTTMVMCVASACLAARKLYKAAPADLF